MCAGLAYLALGGAGGPAGEVMTADGTAMVLGAVERAPTTIVATTAPTTTVTTANAPAAGPTTTTTAEATPTTLPVVASSTTTPVAEAVGDPFARAQQLGAEALERVRFDWRAAFPDWTIEFHGSRDGLRALTYPHEQRIEVFVRPSDDARSLHRVVAHELGHVVDVERNDTDDRDRWRGQRRLADDVPWWPDESKPDFATGAGDFAEAFAVWEAGIASQSSVGDDLDAADLALLVELLD